MLFVEVGNMPILAKGTETYTVSMFEAYNPEIYMGAYSSIGDDVFFMGNANHSCVEYPEVVSTFQFNPRWPGVTNYYTNGGKGPIKIGNDVWIGRETMIMSGITIGDGVIIGARSVVTKSIPPFAMVAGNPARIKKYRFNPEQIKALQKIKWWEWDVNTVKARMEDFKNIDIFIKKYL